MKKLSGLFVTLLFIVFSFLNVSQGVGSDKTLLIISVSSSAADDVIRIKIPTHITPDYHDMLPPAQRFADRINELGKGKIEARLYHSESLVKVKDIIPALMNRWCEIVFHPTLYVKDTWPEIGGIELPFLYKDENDCRNHWTVRKPVFELVNKEMERKYGVRILASGIMKGMIIATRQKAIEKPEDLKNLKIRSIGRIDVEYLKACGAIPLAIGSPEVSDAFNRGNLDGLFINPGTIIARNLDNMLGYIFDTKPLLSEWGYQIYILSKTLESWPPEVRNAVLQAAKEYDEHQLEISLEYYNKEILPRLRKNMKFVSPNAEQMARFREIADGTYKYWSESVDKDFAKKFIEMSRTISE